MDWQAEWDWTAEVAKVIEREVPDLPLLPWTIEEREMGTVFAALVDGEEVARLEGVNDENDKDDAARWQFVPPPEGHRPTKDWHLAAEYLADAIVKEAS